MAKPNFDLDILERTVLRPALEAAKASYENAARIARDPGCGIPNAARHAENMDVFAIVCDGLLARIPEAGA